MNKSTDFKYFSFIILFVLLIYIAVLLVFLCIRRREIKVRQQNRPQNLFFNRDHGNEAYYSFDWTSTVEDVTESWMGGDLTRSMLLFTRVISSLYLFFGGLVFYGSQYPNSFYYFDGWTLILTTIYFILATLLSALKVEVLRARASLDVRANPYYAIVDWTYVPRFMAVGCHMLFEVCCASNFLCAFGVAFQASPDKDDIVIATSLCICLLFLDLGLNNLKFRFDQFPAAVAWIVFYLLCIWPAVYTGSMSKWPYDFLAVEKLECFYYYAMIFVGQFVAFFCWYLFFRVKRVFLHYLEFKGILIPMTMNSPYAQPEFRSFEDDDLASQMSGYSANSRSSLRSRNSRNSDTSSVASGHSGRSHHSHNTGSVVVNSYLYGGDANDFNEAGIAMRAMAYPAADDGSVYGGSMYGGGSSMYGGSQFGSFYEPQQPPSMQFTPEQQQAFIEQQQRMWTMPMPLIPPPPSFYQTPGLLVDATAGNGESGAEAKKDGEEEEEKKATTSEEEQQLQQQLSQQMELQQLQHQAMMQQSYGMLPHQQPPYMMPTGGYWPSPHGPMMMMPPPLPPIASSAGGGNQGSSSELLRAVPHLQDPVYMLEQQQQLYMFNLLHNKESDPNAGTVPLPGASEADFFNPSFPTVPPAPLGLGNPAAPMPYGSFPPPPFPLPPPGSMGYAPPDLSQMDPAQLEQWQKIQEEQAQQYHMMMSSMSMPPYNGMPPYPMYPLPPSQPMDGSSGPSSGPHMEAVSSDPASASAASAAAANGLSGDGVGNTLQNSAGGEGVSSTPAAGGMAYPPYPMTTMMMMPPFPYPVDGSDPAMMQQQQFQQQQEQHQQYPPQFPPGGYWPMPPLPLPPTDSSGQPMMNGDVQHPYGVDPGAAAAINTAVENYNNNNNMMMTMPPPYMMYPPTTADGNNLYNDFTARGIPDPSTTMMMMMNPYGGFGYGYPPPPSSSTVPPPPTGSNLDTTEPAAAAADDVGPPSLLSDTTRNETPSSTTANVVSENEETAI